MKGGENYGTKRRLRSEKAMRQLSQARSKENGEGQDV